MMHAFGDLSRARFKPSQYLDKPYAMVGFNVFGADTDEEAKVLADIDAAGVR